MNDFYQVLGVSRTASPDEIKRAYRKLAHQHHPDKAGAGNEAKFKEINEAYQTLSDPNKRANYDRFGSAEGPAGFSGFGGRSGGPGSASGAGFGGFEDIFGGGIGDIFGEFFGAAMSQVQVELEVSLTQLLLGDEIEFKLNGEKLKFTLPPNTREGVSIRFAGKGQPYRGGRGDLIVTLRQKPIGRLSNEQRRLFEQLRQTGL